MLDALIDHQEYFVPAAKNFATKRRSLGVGVSNLAALLAKEGLKYWDDKAPNFVSRWMEKTSYYLIKASVEMAKEIGKCEKFDRTKFSQGILPIDTYKRDIDEFITEPLHMDWEALREEIKKYGMRHSTLTACMPVESCLSWDTTVVTIDGKKTFHEICESGGIDWKSIEDNNHIGWYSLKYPISVKTLEGIKQVDKIYYNGKKSTFNIEMENGIVVKCTANHKFLVKNENGDVWKHAYELEENDDIVEI
jgi:ribonucleoside-diphosphate reductase alpha chain